MSLSKIFRAVIICLLFNVTAFANNIIIVESQSYHPFHVMDQEWLNIANYNDDDAAIYPQSILEDTNALSQADGLIISSAIIELDDNKINNILTFIKNGGNVYLQSEFLKTLSGNIAFQEIATDLGVSFNWGDEYPGFITQIKYHNSLNQYSDTPVEFDYWFFAGGGSGDENVEVIAEYLGDGVGFSIQSPVAGEGKIITLSDQDWIREQANIDALDYIYQFINAAPVQAPVLAPEIEIAATNMISCPGDIVNFLATTNDIPTPNTLKWFINNTEVIGVNSVSISTAPAAGDVIFAQIAFQKANGLNCIIQSSQIIIPAFNIPDTPILTMTANTTEVCGNESANFNAFISDPTDLSNFSYTWRINGAVASVTPAMSASIGSFPDGAVVTCELTYDTPCSNGLMVTSNELVMEVTTPTSPTIDITGNQTICSGQSLDLIASGTNWGTSPTFVWLVDGVASGQTGPSFSANNLSDGQIITCEVTTGESCVISNTANSNSIETDINPAMTPTISISGSAIGCPDDPITYTASGMGWDNNVVVDWLVDGISIGNNTDTYTTNNLNAGQIVTCELSNITGCTTAPSIMSNELTVSFTPSIVPVVDVMASPVVCQGTSITFTASGVDWDPNATMEWFVDGIATGNNTTELSGTNFMDGQIVNFELSNLSSCYSAATISSDELIVQNLPSVTPTIAISASATVCPGENITFNALGNGWDSNTELEWFVDGITTGNTTDEFSSNSLASGQQVTCEVSNLPQCATASSLVSNNIVVTYTTSSVPTLNITTNNTNICKNEMATISASGDNWGTNFQLTWFVNGLEVDSGNTDLEFNITDENQIITAEVISDADCADGTAIASNPISFEIIQPAQALVTIDVDAFNCANNNYTIQADGTNLGANPTFEWYVDDLSIANTGASLTTVLLPGQRVSLSVQSTNECSTVAVQSNELTIEMVELVATVAERGDAVCAGGNGFARLEATGGQGPYTYLWSDNDTNEFRTAIEAGNYQVTVSDVNGCEDIVDIEIEFKAGPSIEDIEINNVSCTEIFGSAFIFVASDEDVVINWKNEDNQILSTEQMVNNLIVGKYHVEISDANGCFDVREFEVQKMTAPDIIIDNQFAIAIGESTDLEPIFSHDQGEMTYEWSPAVGLSCSDCANPVAAPTSTTTYTLNATTAEGCTTSTSLTIFVEKTSNVYVPNIFSPNGDGINDHLLVFGGQEVVQINSMMVFNRAGETVFSKTNIQPNDVQEGWDGTFKGKEVQSGLYVYFTEVEFIDGRVEIFDGDVFVTK